MQVDLPLSALTKSLTGIPSRDIIRWVNRSREKRLQEVSERNGHIARPMNAFMLYRLAYHEKAKQWFFQNQQQIVSSALGRSWHLESRETREEYYEYARIERINHRAAHPNYRYKPKRLNFKKAKRNNYFDGKVLQAHSASAPDAMLFPCGDI